MKILAHDIHCLCLFKMEILVILWTDLWVTEGLGFHLQQIEFLHSLFKQQSEQFPNRPHNNYCRRNEYRQPKATEFRGRLLCLDLDV